MAAEARCASIQRAASDAILCVNGSGRIEEANPATERLFGYPASELAGEDIGVLVVEPATDDGADCPLRAMRTTEVRYIGPPDCEVVGRRKDGTTFPARLSVDAWWDGRERRFTAIFRDLSERVARDEALVRSEQRFRQIAENVSDAFVVHDRCRGVVSYASPAFEVIWGRPVEELLSSGDRWIEWVHSEDRLRVRRAYEQLFEVGAFAESYRIIRPDGEIRWVFCRTAAVEDGVDGAALDVVVVRDITEERQLQDALAHAQRIEAVGVMAGGIAHDFGNVLQGILGCVTLAGAEDTSPERVREMLDRAAEAARGGAGLAARVMRFSRKGPASPRMVELDTLLEEQVPLVERLLTERVSVVLEPGAPGARIEVDPIQLQQILLNLAANSRDAMPDGGTLRIATNTVVTREARPNNTGIMEPGAWVCLVISDSGTGMPPGVVERIFEPFFTTKEVGEGTGLGLPTVFSATQQLGGHLHVDSEPGVGTRFTFHFPLVGGEPLEAEAEHEVPSFDGVAMLVEDDELVRVTVRHYLEELGFAVVDARHAGAALAVLDSLGRVDLLVSDVNLPLMPGSKLANVMRRHTPDLKVVFITASPELAVGVAESPSTTLIEKPFERRQLAERIGALLAS